MAGFCKYCGKTLKTTGECPDSHCGKGLPKRRPPGPNEISPFPRASRPRRLLGSGIEFFAYFIGGLIVLAMDSLTFGILGLAALVIAGLIFLRDFNGGVVSIAKRVGRMRVVGYKTGEPASNTQAFLRNIPYFVLFILFAFPIPIPFIDASFMALFSLLVGFDILLIFANPQGRRMGDLLAGTQVVEVRN